MKIPSTQNDQTDNNQIPLDDTHLDQWSFLGDSCHCDPVKEF